MGNTVFLADYAVNPLGVKSDDAIAGVVDSWLGRAAKVSDTLIIACNTLSIRYHQLHRSTNPVAAPAQIISMVDCFAAMVQENTCRLAGKRVLIVGTEFTASQGLYAEILDRSIPGIDVDTVAATELERKIARFERWDGQRDSSLSTELRNAIEETDIAVLACTCFPMVKDDLQASFPDVVFLDPGAYCPDLTQDIGQGHGRTLSLSVTGNAVSEEDVLEYARFYLDVGFDDSIASQGSE